MILSETLQHCLQSSAIYWNHSDCEWCWTTLRCHIVQYKQFVYQTKKPSTLKSAPVSVVEANLLHNDKECNLQHHEAKGGQLRAVVVAAPLRRTPVQVQTEPRHERLVEVHQRYRLHNQEYVVVEVRLRDRPPQLLLGVPSTQQLEILDHGSECWIHNQFK